MSTWDVSQRCLLIPALCITMVKQGRQNLTWRYKIAKITTIIFWRSTASYFPDTQIEIWHHIENPECVHWDVLSLQHLSPSTRVWHLFPLIPLIQEKGLVCAFCRTNISAKPLATPVPEGRLHRKCVSLLDFNSHPQVWQWDSSHCTCASRIWYNCCLLKVFLNFSFQHLLQIILVFFLLKNTCFPLNHVGLVNLEDKQKYPSSLSKWIIQGPGDLSGEGLNQDCTHLSLH